MLHRPSTFSSSFLPITKHQSVFRAFFLKRPFCNCALLLGILRLGRLLFASGCRLEDGGGSVYLVIRWLAAAMGGGWGGGRGTRFQRETVPYLAHARVSAIEDAAVVRECVHRLSGGRR